MQMRMEQGEERIPDNFVEEAKQEEANREEDEDDDSSESENNSDCETQLLLQHWYIFNILLLV
jgi:hypothetical protein